MGLDLFIVDLLCDLVKINATFATTFCASIFPGKIPIDHAADESNGNGKQEQHDYILNHNCKANHSNIIAHKRVPLSSDNVRSRTLTFKVVQPIRAVC